MISIVKRVDDTKEIQEIQVEGLEGEILEEIENYQYYGFSSNPPEGSEVILKNENSDLKYGIASANREIRKNNLKPGEVAIYTKTGNEILITVEGNIEIKANSKIKITGNASSESIEKSILGETLKSKLEDLIDAILEINVISPPLGGTTGTVSALHSVKFNKIKTELKDILSGNLENN